MRTAIAIGIAIPRLIKRTKRIKRLLRARINPYVILTATIITPTTILLLKKTLTVKLIINHRYPRPRLPPPLLSYKYNPPFRP